MKPRCFEADDAGDAFVVDVDGQVGHILRGRLRPFTEADSEVVTALDADGEEVSVMLLSTGTPRLLPHVFVYGTLRRGGRWHSFMTSHGATLHGPVVVRGKLLDLGSYPGLVHGEGEVHGEVWSHPRPAALLADLDELEDFAGYGRDGSMYRRIIIHTSLGLAWTYLLLDSSAACGEVEGGDWMRPR